VNAAACSANSHCVRPRQGCGVSSRTWAPCKIFVFVTMTSWPHAKKRNRGRSRNTELLFVLARCERQFTEMARLNDHPQRRRDLVNSDFRSVRKNSDQTHCVQRLLYPQAHNNPQSRVLST